MIQARINRGRIEVQEPIPEQWEGQLVKIIPLTPDDPQPELEGRLCALEKLGPVEFDPDERALAAEMLQQLDSVSRDAMQRIAGPQP